MWPLLLDMTKEESIQSLRNLELEAYSHLVSALRAQGPLNSDKKKLLKETSYVLNITQERHKAEIRRAINDEKLNTIAYHVTGHSATLEDWALEGRRLVPLLPRTAPQTAYSALADETCETANQCNKQLPSPSSTERKRQSVIPITTAPSTETSKTLPFRIPEPPKVDDNKKRKLACQENNLTHHLLAPKVCRIQQLYRQRSKPKLKEFHKKNETDQVDLPQHKTLPQGASVNPPSQHLNQKVNILQNISLQPIKEEMIETEESASPKSLDIAQSIGSNENQVPKSKILTNVKPTTNIILKTTPTQIAGSSTDFQKSIKMCSGKKTITKTVNSGQKLIVVSNAQTVSSNSILQRTLQIPFVKNVSIKNFEKFKIVTSNATPTSIQVTNVSNSGMNSVKHKVVTVKTNPTTKKVIPLSQLQVLNSKGSIKVLPLGGKIVGKSVATTSSPLLIVNTTQQSTKSSPSQPITPSKLPASEDVKVKSEIISEAPSTVPVSPNRENGKSSVLEDILKASGVIAEETEDYDAKIEEFHIPQTKAKHVETENTEEATKQEDETFEDIQDFSTYQAGQVDTFNEIDAPETDIKEYIEQMGEISVPVIEDGNSLNQTFEKSTDVRTDEFGDVNGEETPQVVFEV